MKPYQKNIAIGICALSLITSIAQAQLDSSKVQPDHKVFTGGATPVDADTFYLSGGPMKIRVWGFDAPGARDKNQPESVKAYAPEATRYFNELTRSGVSCGRQRGKTFDRTVHKCWGNYSDRDIAADMVLAGFGVDWPKFSKGEYADEEAAARGAGRGIWKTESVSWIK